jgi:hypothetical protein
VAALRAGRPGSGAGFLRQWVPMAVLGEPPWPPCPGGPANHWPAQAAYRAGAAVVLIVWLLPCAASDDAGSRY